MNFENILNPEQERAVRACEGPVLILAGAGSGKTRVLTHRIAYLISEKKVNPWNILAITFTNKAAGEMKERIASEVMYGADEISVGTFHATCARILRRHADLLGYDSHFTIYDSDDSMSIVKSVCKRFNLEYGQLKAKTIRNRISACKDNLISVTEYQLSAGNDRDTARIATGYREYDKELKKNNAMDFDDLIVNVVKLFREHPDVLTSYQERYQYIHVDEYQDTNTAQFELIRLLAGSRKNLCVVGDDDQSIYKFRGANIRNILDFESNYPDATVIRLEQNYRSTQPVLDVANAVIRNNRGRKEKHLWSDIAGAAKPVFQMYDTGPEEAEAIALDIARLHRTERIPYSEMAVLYRTNAQSRLIEERFVKEGIPYTLVGGVNFYARKEIKDLLSYLKTIDNGIDDLAVRRIINVPKRGIGPTTVEHVQTYASSKGISFFEALCVAENIPAVARSVTKLKNFVTMIRAFRTRMQEESLEELLQDVMNTVGYLDYIRELDDQDESGDNDREMNIDELLSKLADYELVCQDMGEEATLSGFLEEIALVADIDSVEGGAERVLLMTLHAAKGLEFTAVTISGMEEGLFPGYMSIAADEAGSDEMEEERRLAYVGITRAKKYLTLTAAKSRMLRGEIRYNQVSRFVDEIPLDLLDDNSTRYKRKNEYRFEDDAGEGAPLWPARPKATPRKMTRQAPFIAGAAKGLTALHKGAPPPVAIDYSVGDRVKHAKWGEGEVRSMEAGPRDTKVEVAFDDGEVRIMYAAFAKLEKVVL